MKHFFKTKKCNDYTKWVVYSDDFYKKLLESHPFTPSVFISFHLKFLDKCFTKTHKHHFSQSDPLNDLTIPKINEINKNKNINQLYAQRMVSRDGLFDTEISDTPEKQLEFLNWYFNLIYPL